MENKATKTDDARQLLLLNGMKLFAKNGLDGTSTRDIAKASNLNISLISYYFGGKEGLYKAVLEDSATQMLEQMVQILAEVQYDKLNRESFKKLLTQMIDCVVTTKLQYPEMGMLFQREVISGFPFAKEIYQKVYGTVSEKVIVLLSEAQKKKIIRADINLPLFLSLVSEALNGYFLMRSCCPTVDEGQFKFPQQKEDFLHQFVAIFLEGIMI